MFGIRRQSRVFALQLLYLMEMQQSEAESLQVPYWRRAHASKKARAFAQQLVQNTCEHRPQIDALLTEHLANWKLHRLPVMVRQILRLALCEMLIIKETPHQVVINEALELTRSYMDEASASFINSVLDKCWHAQANPPQKDKD